VVVAFLAVKTEGGEWENYWQGQTDGKVKDVIIETDIEIKGLRFGAKIAYDDAPVYLLSPIICEPVDTFVTWFSYDNGISQQITVESGKYFSIRVDNLKPNTGYQCRIYAQSNTASFESPEVYTVWTVKMKPSIISQWEENVTSDGFTACAKIALGDYHTGTVWMYCFDLKTMEKQEIRESIAVYENEIVFSHLFSGEAGKKYRWNVDYIYDNDRVRGEYRDVVLPYRKVSVRDVTLYAGIFNTVLGCVSLGIGAKVTKGGKRWRS
jgi:hypothetical protein